MIPSCRRSQVVTSVHLAATLLIGTALPACSEDPDSAFELEAGTPVVLVVIDTLRADHLSCYDYELPTSPILDEFAATATLFEANTTQCNSTFPSLTSILTGLYPKTHRNYVAVPLESTTVQSEGAACLAERFKRRGYHTTAVVSHPFLTIEPHKSVMQRGWDEFSVVDESIPVEVRALYGHAGYTNERLFPLLDAYAERGGDEPLFLWAHYFDPHTDLPPFVYNAPPETRNLYLAHHLEALGVGEWAEKLAPLEPVDRTDFILENCEDEEERWRVRLANGRSLYDAEITSCDAGIGELFDKLRAMGIYDRAVIVVMADHGENMEARTEQRGALAFSHTKLFEGVAHTPLIVKLPGQVEGRRIGALAQNIDVTPTLIELLDLPVNPPVEGRSLVPLLKDPSRTVHERVFIESSNQISRAVKTDGLKFIDRGEEDEPLVFRWRADREEAEDVRDSVSPTELAQLEQAMADFRPIDAVRIRLAPAPEPYDVQLEVDFPRFPITKVVGAPPDTIQGDGHQFRWEGTVEGAARDFILFPEHRGTEMRWRLTHSAADYLPDVVYVGRTPLARSTAIPIWSPAEGDPPGDPQLSLSRKKDQGKIGFRLFPQDEQLLEAELRYREASYKKDFTLVLEHNFGEMTKDRKTVHSLANRTSEPATAMVRRRMTGDDVYALLRFDGEWPDARRIDLDGGPVDLAALEFTFPFPVDGRIMAALMANFAAEEAPPGSISIWLETGGGGGEIDVSTLPPDQVEILRALGYVK